MWYSDNLFFRAIGRVVGLLGRAGVGGGPDENQLERETQQWQRIEGVPEDSEPGLDRDPMR